MNSEPTSDEAYYSTNTKIPITSCNLLNSAFVGAGAATSCAPLPHFGPAAGCLPTFRLGEAVTNHPYGGGLQRRSALTRLRWVADDARVARHSEAVGRGGTNKKLRFLNLCFCHVSGDICSKLNNLNIPVRRHPKKTTITPFFDQMQT